MIALHVLYLEGGLKRYLEIFAQFEENGTLKLEGKTTLTS